MDRENNQEEASTREVATSSVEQQLFELSEQKSAIQEEMRQLTQQSDMEAAKISAATKLQAMTPQERKILGLPEPQVAEVTGIDSTEEVSSLDN